MKYSGIIAQQAQENRLELEYVSPLDCEGRPIWIANAHRDDGRRFVVHADEKLTAFVELETAIQARQNAQRICERVKIRLDTLSRIK